MFFLKFLKILFIKLQRLNEHANFNSIFKRNRNKKIRFCNFNYDCMFEILIPALHQNYILVNFLPLS